MIRKIIEIDDEKCDGCGICVEACHEGAIQLIDGKAKLVREIYCDGLGDCIGECPQGAISFIQREAKPYDPEATDKHLANLQGKEKPHTLACGCPGSAVREIERHPDDDGNNIDQEISSALSNWPVQLHLIPATAPYLKGADLLLVADCVPFAYADFHRKFLAAKPVIIGCPKLDDAQFYVKKLAEIFHIAQPKSLKIIHMEVPCCSRLTKIADAAMKFAGVDIPADDITISIEGKVLDKKNSKYTEPLISN